MATGVAGALLVPDVVRVHEQHVPDVGAPLELLDDGLLDLVPAALVALQAKPRKEHPQYLHRTSCCEEY